MKGRRVLVLLLVLVLALTLVVTLHVASPAKADPWATHVVFPDIDVPGQHEDVDYIYWVDAAGSGTVSGILSGSFNFFNANGSIITSGNYTHWGAGNGAWNATIDGQHYQGNYTDVYEYDSAAQTLKFYKRLYGDIEAGCEGTVTNFSPVPSLPIPFSAACEMTMMGDHEEVGQFTLEGRFTDLTIESAVVNLHIGKDGATGNAQGAYNGLINIVATLIAGQGFPFHDFAFGEYNSDWCMGDWAAYISSDRGVSGVCDGPLIGTFSGTVDDFPLVSHLEITIEHAAGAGPLGGVIGYKFWDYNFDGMIAWGEPGLSGWTIEIRDGPPPWGAVVATRTTWFDGFYLCRLLPDVYWVGEVLKAGWDRTTDDWVQVDLRGLGCKLVRVDFGNCKRGIVSGYKWEDVDFDGVRDADEPFVGGWTIRLEGKDLDGNIVGKNEITGLNDGRYKFDPVKCGKYTLIEDPAGVFLGDGGDPTWDPTKDQQYKFDMQGADIIRNFGNCERGDIVGWKVDSEGVGLGGWTITLTGESCTGAEINHQNVTDNGGFYQFTDVPCGDYTLDEELQPGWVYVSGLGAVKMTSGATIRRDIVNRPVICGDCVVEPPWEQCDPPAKDSVQCPQTTEKCEGPFLFFRDGKGDCDANCWCVEDPWSDGICEKGKCGAECAVDADCPDPGKCRWDCMCAKCGDGIIDPEIGEECDPAATPTGCPEGMVCIQCRCYEFKPCVIEDTYGPQSSEVETLRNFRDQYLVTNPVGEALAEFYYEISQPIAEFIAEHPVLKPVVKVGLFPAVAIATVATNTNLTQKMAIGNLLVLVPLLLVGAIARNGGFPGRKKR